jgi:hypothetical protein
LHTVTTHGFFLGWKVGIVEDLLVATVIGIDGSKAFDKTRGINVISPISPVIEPLATSDVLSRRRPAHKN